jgi:hypothetical protein
MNLGLANDNRDCIYGFPQVFQSHARKESKGKAISVTGCGDVFPVRYEHNLHKKSKGVPVTGSGGLYSSETKDPTLSRLSARRWRCGYQVDAPATSYS